MDSLLLLTMFLMSCGWQITHQLIVEKEIQFGSCIFVGLMLLNCVSSYCDSQIDGFCNAFTVVDYIFQSIVIVVIIVCTNVNISSTSSILQSSQYNASTIRVYVSRATFSGLLWAFLVYILRSTFVKIIGTTVLSWKYEDLIIIVDESILLYVVIRLRIIVHPFSYKGYYRVNREIISHMNQLHADDEMMPMEQPITSRRNQPFTPIPNDGVYNRG